ncbi:MAG: bifunctional diguanylate cyclase/phosphodiesterase [Campylobacterota bacterium]|nr:bifunctional diguanylate cyclase/phosphodiesterase [Campylobacterota bacterium]
MTKEELEKRVVELESLYYHDELTTLPNRIKLLEDFKKHTPYGLLLIDIKGFSTINDFYGIKVGDTLLQSITKFLQSFVNKDKTFYKIGADQFVYLEFEKDSSRYQFNEDKVKQMMHTIENTPIKVEIENDNVIDINIYISAVLVENVSTDNILELADMTLHYAKDTKQPFLKYCDDLKLTEKFEKDIAGIKMVKTALEEDRLIAYYQPIIKSYGNSYECLVRIQEGDRIISPFFFLDAVAKTKYYTQLTQRMIEKSFQYFEDKDCTFSINLSFDDIADIELVSFIRQKMIQYNVADRLILEILESENIVNFHMIRDFIYNMQLLGVQIAIDDFGSGYSNFTYLLELKPDYIKIDGSLIKDICKVEESYILVRTITNLAHELAIKVIAEYIENEEIYNKAKRLYIDGYQGYYLGTPNSTMEIKTL